MEKEKKPKWNSEVWATVTPPDDIQCKDCIHRLKPVKVCGDVFERHTNGSCQVYAYPKLKPHDVLWEGAPCEFYEKDKSKE